MSGVIEVSTKSLKSVQGTHTLSESLMPLKKNWSIHDKHIIEMWYLNFIKIL
jgi:hypothetical protein